jgi:FMN phosphatase YigB (HAD superfamily)
VITLGDYKMRKPHKTPFNTALKNLGLKPEEVIFVGDNPQRDIAGGNKIGMKTVLAKYGLFIKGTKSSKNEKPDYTINNFKDLLKLI